MHAFLNKCYIVGMLCLRKRHATALLREGVQNVGLVRGPYSHVGHMPTVWKKHTGAPLFDMGAELRALGSDIL